MNNRKPNHGRNRQNNRGYTVLELVFSLAMLSSTLASASLLIFHWMKADATLRHQLLHMNNIDRLARDLRRDAHEYGKWDPEQSTFSNNDGATIKYIIEDNVITRLESQSNKTVRRQQYIVLPDWTARWETQPDNLQAIRLELVRLTPPDSRTENETDQKIYNTKMTVLAAVGTSTRSHTGQSAKSDEVPK